jgi:hypothetical protein
MSACRMFLGSSRSRRPSAYIDLQPSSFFQTLLQRLGSPWVCIKNVLSDASILEACSHLRVATKSVVYISESVA